MRGDPRPETIDRGRLAGVGGGFARLLRGLWRPRGVSSLRQIEGEVRADAMKEWDAVARLPVSPAQQERLLGVKQKVWRLFGLL